MSVYVKGMEMPHDCDSCKVSDILNCTLWKPMDVGERHPDCPLVEVPTPHGRLIDADEITKELSYVLYRPVKSQMYIIGQAPTVIEAEDE